jgi:hypothetical protein
MANYGVRTIRANNNMTTQDKQKSTNEIKKSFWPFEKIYPFRILTLKQESNKCLYVYKLNLLLKQSSWRAASRRASEHGEVTNVLRSENRLFRGQKCNIYWH